MIGETVSHYRVLDKLGAGGMGVVYRAQDTHLSRFVALKILSASAVNNPDRKKRFIQEAKAASALNHPNIITVYDIDSSAGTDFIVMEYVEGTTLEQAISRRGLPLPEALRYAIEIADALAAAHGAGIIHRDLKPGNIMVTPKGRIKVLDFGLAKLARHGVETTAGGGSLPTETLTWADGPHTEEGIIVGSIAYMSPEQAASREVDRRSDIFAFGSVLYEMLTGSRAFPGADKISILAAILQQDPAPARQIRPALPPEIDRIICRCLRKDPGRRFQHMDDLRVALQDLSEDSESGRLLSQTPAMPPRTCISPFHIAVFAVVLAATAAASWWLSRTKAIEYIPALTRLTSDSGLTWEPALSPDGKLIAYSSDRGTASAKETNLDIWVQQVVGGEPIHLTHDPADDREPAFSPDSFKIAFRSDRDRGGIYLMPALGGDARLIAKDGQTPHFSPDGQWIAYWVGNRITGDPTAPGSAQGYIAPTTGGPPRPFHPEFSVIRYPIWAPDGKRLLFWGKLDPRARGADAVDWWVASIDSMEAVRTGAAAALRSQDVQMPISPGVWLPDGSVVFATRRGDTSDLWELHVDAAGRAIGLPLRLTSGTGISEQPSVIATRDDRGRSLIRLAFSGLARDTQIWSLPLDANRGKAPGALHRLTEGPVAAEYGSLSMDGRKLVFVRSSAGQGDIWIKDLQTGREVDLTPTPDHQFHPRITADGSKVSYSERKGGKSFIYTMSIGLSPVAGLHHGVPEKLCEDCRWSWQWSFDGTRILFDAGSAGRPVIMLANVASGEKTTLLSHPKFNLYQSNSSPDGRWVAFLAHVDSQHSRLFIAPFHPAPASSSNAIPSDWIPATSGQFWDDKPRWSPDGNLLYFISDRDGFLCIWGQRLDPATKQAAGPPFDVFHFHNASRSIMNVGMATLEPSVARDRIILNLGEITGNIWVGNLERIAR